MTEKSTSTRKFSLYDLTPSELKGFFASIGEKPYRAKQALDFLYRNPVDSIEKFTTLPAELRNEIGKIAHLTPLRLRASLESSDKAVKHAYELLSEKKSGILIESVWMPTESADRDSSLDRIKQSGGEQSKRYTICISSQAGCAAGCTFCATGKMGLKAQLTAGEIVYQVVHCMEIYKRLPDTVLFMGMGEPMHNFESVCAAVEIMTDEEALAFSERRIVLSTVGEIDKLDKFHRKFPRARMAISLTAPTDNLRDSIVPVNKRFNLQDVQNFIRKVDLHRGDRITIEYALMEGVNDTDEMTGRLLGYLKPITSRIKVNLIPWNTVSGLKFRSPDMARVFAMQEKMKAAGILTFIRKNRGRDSSAACGQLAGRI